MSAQRRGMGRGLAAILPEQTFAGADFREVPVTLIRPNPDQPRRSLDPDSISALAASISEAGMIQPLVLRPLKDGRYELIAGERRWRAAREAGLELVPALIRDDGETERMQTALIENVVREDLNPVDEARACAALIDELGVSKEELGRRLGRSRVAISNLIRLLDLPDEALELLAAAELTEGHGRAILQAQGQDRRRELARAAASQGWSVRETERRAEGSTPPGPRAAPHPDEAEALREAEEQLESALGTGVRVKAAGKGIRAELRFDDLDELREFARRRSG
jgi:ParB family transcriptional regulator, chromosome partitioning protein